MANAVRLIQPSIFLSRTTKNNFRRQRQKAWSDIWKIKITKLWKSLMKKAILQLWTLSLSQFLVSYAYRKIILNCIGHNITSDLCLNKNVVLSVNMNGFHVLEIALYGGNLLDKWQNSQCFPIRIPNLCKLYTALLGVSKRQKKEAKLLFAEWSDRVASVAGISFYVAEIKNFAPFQKKGFLLTYACHMPRLSKSMGTKIGFETYLSFLFTD